MLKFWAQGTFPIIFCTINHSVWTSENVSCSEETSYCLICKFAFEILTNFLAFYCEQGQRLAGKRTEAFIQRTMKTLMQLCCPFEGCPTIWAPMESANSFKWSEGQNEGLIAACESDQPLVKKEMATMQKAVHIWTFISCTFIQSQTFDTVWLYAVWQEAIQVFIVFYFRLLVPSGGPQNRSYQTNSLLLVFKAS